MATAKALPVLIQPNLYQLSTRQHHAGNNLKVSYITHSGPATPQSPQGPPHFTYEDESQTLSFAGPEVEVVKTELGEVVSVVIERTVDGGSTTFGLLVPNVNIHAGQQAAIHTEGITAIHQPTLLPGTNIGQRDKYSVMSFEGTASDIIVPQ
jgi:hypothetical protein